MNLINLPEDVFGEIWLYMDIMSKLKLLEAIVDTPSKFEYFFTQQFFASDELNEILKNFTTFAFVGCINLIKIMAQLKPDCKFDSDVCANAAGFGHLEILKWLRSQNPPCPWNEDACAYATKSGHLEVLMWLCTQNPPCPLSWKTYDVAHQNFQNDGFESLKVLIWIRDQYPHLQNIGDFFRVIESGDYEKFHVPLRPKLFLSPEERNYNPFFTGFPNYP